MPDDPIVTPLAETAEPVETQQEAPPSPQPEATPPADSPAAESVEGSSPDAPLAEDQPKADPPKPEKSQRERLIDQLTGVEEPKSKDEEAEPTPPAAKQDPAPSTTEDIKLDETADDLVEITNDDVKAMKPGEGRRKINRLIKRLKDSEPFAQGYKEIVDTCAANGFAPDDYKAWVGLGIGLQRGNPKAVEMLQQIAAKAGIATGAPAGVTPEVETWLEAQVKDLEISTTAAANLRKLLGGPASKAPTPQPPAPVQPPTPAPAPVVDVQRQKAGQDLDRVVEEYETKLGKARFDELQPRLMAALKARKGAHPGAWGDIMRAAIETELAKLPKPAAIHSNLRPGSSGGSSPPAFKTERERVLHKLTNG